MMKSRGIFGFMVAFLLALTTTTVTFAESPVRLMTWNIRFDNPADGPDQWTNRRDRVAQFIRDEHVELFGLQEALKTQIDELAERLPGYTWYGVGRDDGKEEGEYVPVFYERERFELVDEGAFWLSDKPEEPGRRDWGAACARVTTWVRLRHRASQQELVFYNTHFDHVSDEARRNGAKLIRERMGASDVAAQVLVGDLNARADSAAVAALTSAPEGGAVLLQQAYEIAGEKSGPDATWNGFRGIQHGHRIDHIFVTRVLKVSSHTIFDPRVEERFASDHLPVVADILLP